MRKNFICILLALLAFSCNQTPVYANPLGNAVATAQTATAASNAILKASGGMLNSLSVTTGATAGYVMVFDSATLPANGTVTPKFCYGSLPATSGIAVSYLPYAVPFVNGITVAFSSTGCFTLTASATAFISGQVQ
jgi:hypothetical protein